MTDFTRVLAAYDQQLRQLLDEVVADLDPSPEERVHLLLVTQLLQSIVRTYGAFHSDDATALDASISVMYAAGQEAGEVLNVPLRSLVDAGMLTPWQARFVNGNLGLKRTVLVTGGPGTGKSTLLNALLALLPADQQLFSLGDDAAALPVMRTRASVVRLAPSTAGSGRAELLRQVSAAKPDWIVVEEPRPSDRPALFDIVDDACGTLGTIACSDPEAYLNDRLAEDKALAERLTRTNPLFLHLERDKGGHPRLVDVMEAAVKAGTVVLQVRRPV